MTDLCCLRPSLLGCLYIALAIVAGCTVRGRVELTVGGSRSIGSNKKNKKKGCRLPPSLQLKLKLEGKEKTKITYQSPVTHNRVILTDEAKIKKSNHKITLSGGYDVNNDGYHQTSDDEMLPNHTYHFPFEFQVPKKLPSTTTIEQPKDWISSTIGIRDRMGSFSLEYWLLVKTEMTTTDGDSDDEDSDNKNHKHHDKKNHHKNKNKHNNRYILTKRPLSIASRELPSALEVTTKLKPEMVEPTYLPITQTTTMFGGIMKLKKKYIGCIGVAARIPHSHVGRGDTMQLYLTIMKPHSLSKLITITHIQILLLECIEWKAEHLNKYKEQKFHLLDISSGDDDGVGDDDNGCGIVWQAKKKKHESEPEELANIDEHTTIQDKKLRKTMIDHLFNDDQKNLLTLTIPNSGFCRDTYTKGELIRIEHFIKIIIHTTSTSSNNEKNSSGRRRRRSSLSTSYPKSSPPPSSPTKQSKRRSSLSTALISSPTTTKASNNIDNSISNCSVEIPIVVGFAPLPDVVATRVVGNIADTSSSTTDIDEASIVRELPFGDAIEYHFEHL